jgi:hypothetical protein
MSRLRYLTSPALAFGCVAVLTACGGSQADTKPAEPAASGPSEAERNAVSQPVQTESDANGAIERIDVNGDHKPDVFKFYRNVEVVGADPAAPKAVKRALLRKELDVNFDQRIDIVEFYEGEPGKEQKVKEDFDLDFDGRVDETRHYKDGNVTLIELDLGFDGKTDTWSYFQLTQNEEGKPVNRLVERRRDSSGDGAVDVWEYYTKGVIVKIGTDSNGDGTPDQFQRVDQKGAK